MATRKKTVAPSTSTVIVPSEQPSVALAPMSTSDLLGAGITDFKLTKDDLIDLLVDDATQTLEAELAVATARRVELQTEWEESKKTLSDQYNAERLLLVADPLAKLRKVFNAEQEIVECHDVYGKTMINVAFLGALVESAEHRHDGAEHLYQLTKPDVSTGYCEVTYRVELARVTLHAPGVKSESPEILAIKKSRAALHKKHTEASQAEQEAQGRIRELRYSSKKLRTQLIRKVLDSNANGGAILDNVKGLSRQFITSLKASKSESC